MKNQDGIIVVDSNKAFDILELLKRHPERYLTSRTITSLQDFINGFLIGKPYPDDKPPFWNFNHYLLNVTNFENNEGSGNLLSRILLNECNGNEFQSFDKFFEYLENYKNSL